MKVKTTVFIYYLRSANHTKNARIAKPESKFVENS